MDAAVILTAEAIKRAHCGETADKMVLKDCMVGKAQVLCASRISAAHKK